MLIIQRFYQTVNQCPYFLAGFCLASAAAILPESALPAVWIKPVAVNLMVPPVLEAIVFCVIVCPSCVVDVCIIQYFW